MKSAISAVVLGSAVLLGPSVASAQQNMQGYIVDRSGNPIISSRTGECVRSRNWSAASEIARCKPTTTPAAAASRAPAK